MEVADLKLADIEFLSAAQKINNNPEQYQGTDKSAVPANSQNIRKNTSLEPQQVNYRMGGRSNSRGLAESGLIEPHEPISYHGPRSITVTERGSEFVNQAQNRAEEISGVSRKEHIELVERVDKLHRIIGEVGAFNITNSMPDYQGNVDETGFALDKSTSDEIAHILLTKLINRADAHAARSDDPYPAEIIDID